MPAPTAPSQPSLYHEKNRTITTMRESRRSPAFLTLPLELHLLIASHLAFPSYLSIRLTHPYLYHALAAPLRPVPLRDLDLCARVAVRTYLAPYLTPRSETKPTENTLATTAKSAVSTNQQESGNDGQTHQRCALCGQVYPVRLFKSAASPACSPQDLGPIRRTPGEEGSIGQETVERSDGLADTRRVREDKHPVAVKGEAVKNQDAESVETGDAMAKRGTRPLTWSCSLRPARTYTRYAEHGWSCGGFVFWRDNEGKLWVRETIVAAATDVTSRRSTYVDKPVIFE
ncbi:hypothetical protein GTA08_BOTSDO00908 [Botryosphaeria dothidea]|uniref:F-box domain-containing protein n=1 Tax=Botryosphaeria dothidea TaxID=55169 RepID=A0A8H4NGW0_9PEZI|nr:hypothetical protein GTA08_BOTSDO00908 [Botryosphaeria dothidea]